MISNVVPVGVSEKKNLENLTKKVFREISVEILEEISKEISEKNCSKSFLKILCKKFKRNRLDIYKKYNKMCCLNT